MHPAMSHGLPSVGGRVKSSRTWILPELLAGMAMLVCLGICRVSAQDISGYWQGVLYQEFPGNTVYYPYSMSLQQTGTDVTGISEIRWATEPMYYGIMSLTGQFDGSLFTFQEQAILDQNPNPAAYWCIKNGELLYDQVQQTLEGPWYAPGCYPGTVELHRLALASDTIFCLGDVVRLEVTGIGIRWYADSTLQDLLASGNVFFPNITATTVFYVTQTHYGTESPAFPVRAVISEPLLTDVQVQPAGCESDSGTLGLGASGGIPPYSFSLDGGPFQTEAIFSGLAAGSYQVVLRDSLGCSDAIQVDIPVASGPQIINVDAPDIPCGRDTITVQATATGGTGILGYSLDGALFSEQPVFRGVGPGPHMLWVMDEAGCRDSLAFTLALLPGPSLLDAASQDPTCMGGDGRILLRASGGTAPLSYSLEGLVFQSDSLFTALDAGTWTVRVRDAWGCVDSMPLTLEAPSGFSVGIMTDTARCAAAPGGFTVTVQGGTAPFQFRLDGEGPVSVPVFSGLGEGTYTLIVRDMEGCADTLEVTVPGIPPPVIRMEDKEDAWCGQDNGLILVSGTGGSPPYRYAWSGGAFQDAGFFGDLPGGVHILVLEDIAGCRDSLFVTLLQTGVPVLEELLIGAATCGRSDGSLEVRASGGSGALQYRLGTGVSQGQGRFTGLAPGNYTLYIRDEQGCEAETVAVIPGAAAITLDGLVVSPPACGAGNGRIEAYGQGLRFAIRGGAPQESGIFEGLAEGNYPLRILSDDCVLDTFLRLEDGPCPYFIPTAFSPNGDGINDVLQVFGPAGQRVLVLRMALFDRWGEWLWEEGGFYLDEPHAPWWDGRFRGKPLDGGVFVYFLELLPEGSGPIRLKGDVQLIR